MLGHIVSEKKIILENPHFSYSNKLGNNEIPTLIIGYEFALKLFPNNDLISKKISDTLQWTFSKQERRAEFESDLDNFMKQIYKNFINEIEYVYIDPLFLKKQAIKKIIYMLNSSESIYVHESFDKMLYIYNKKYLFGLDLFSLSYFGFNIDKLKKKIKGLKIKKHTYFSDEMFKNWEYFLTNFPNDERIIPAIFSNLNG